MAGINRTVDGEYAVEMVDLMLKEFSKTVRGGERTIPARQVLILHRDPEKALHLHQYIGKREAVVPERHRLSGPFDDAGVQELKRLVNINIDDPLRYADLRRCDAAAEPL